MRCLKGKNIQLRKIFRDGANKRQMRWRFNLHRICLLSVVILISWDS